MLPLDRVWNHSWSHSKPQRWVAPASFPGGQCKSLWSSAPSPSAALPAPAPSPRPVRRRWCPPRRPPPAGNPRGSARCTCAAAAPWSRGRAGAPRCAGSPPGPWAGGTRTARPACAPPASPSAAAPPPAAARRAPAREHSDSDRPGCCLALGFRKLFRGRLEMGNTSRGFMCTQSKALMGC